jgi:exoribonuclease R
VQAATLADKRLVVAVDCWEADSLYPSGHYVRTLGAIGDKETETEVGGRGRSIAVKFEPVACLHSHTTRQHQEEALPVDNLFCWSNPALMTPRACHTVPATARVQVLLIENDINTNPFTQAVHACVPPLPWSVSEADLADPNRCGGVGCCNHFRGTFCWSLMAVVSLAVPAAWPACLFNSCICLLSHYPPPDDTTLRALSRADLRHLAVCSVDPPGCKDIDDALHVRRLPNGNFELGEWCLVLILGSGCLERRRTIMQRRSIWVQPLF